MNERNASSDTKVGNVKGGDMHAEADRVMWHLLGWCCNLYTGIEDQLKTMNILEIWYDLNN